MEPPNPTPTPCTEAGHQEWAFRLAPRCCAKTRAGLECQSPAVKGKARCRMHGGAKGSGAPTGERNGAYRHGLRTGETVAFEREAKAFLRVCRKKPWLRRRRGAALAG